MTSQSKPRQHAVERVAIAVVDLAFGERLPDRDELVAGREECNPQPPVDRDFVDAERGHHADLRGPQRLTVAEQDAAALQVLAGEAPVLSGLAHRSRSDRHAAGRLLRALLHDDRVGARRHDRAGEDADRLSRLHRAAERLARERFTDARKPRAAVAATDPRSGRPSRPSRSCRAPERRSATRRRWRGSGRAPAGYARARWPSPASRKRRINSRARSTGIESGS